jgi:hypothetical protein
MQMEAVQQIETLATLWLNVYSLIKPLVKLRINGAQTTRSAQQFQRKKAP